jgi:TRAP-type C4-dicarboxylate transport system substrate-binding protein
MKHFLKTALLAASLAVPAGMASAEITMNAVTLAPKQASISGPFGMFVDAVNERFEGEFQINWRGGPEVMPAFGQAESVRNGAIDMTYTSPSYYSGLVPTSGTMNLSFKRYAEIAETDYHERMTELHAEKGLVFLGEIPATDLNFLMYMGDEITSLEDIRGKRIRVFPALVPLVEALGAEPIVLPMGEIFTAMERGAIDGFMQGPVNADQQFEGLVETVVYPGVYRAGFPVLVNADAWAEVPEDLQTRIVSFLRDEIAFELDTIWEDDVLEAQAKMDAAGFNRVTLPPEEAARLEEIAMDAAWAATAESAGAEIAAELRAMLDN